MADPESTRGNRPNAAPARNDYPQFRAPEQDGQALVDPGWARLPALVADNAEMAAGLEYDFHGVPLAGLREAARGSLLHACGVEDLPRAARRPLVLTGHQPELFHPGVWFKNFAAGALTKRLGGLGVNLIIDSDLCRSPSILAPTGPIESPRTTSIALDAPADPLPYEQRQVADWATLRGFPGRVSTALDGLVADPLVGSIWPDALAAAERHGNLGLAIAAARHNLETRWGNHTLETPMSSVCDAAPFQAFAAHLFTRVEDFHQAHNGALAEYRTAHRLRSPAQPVPDLHVYDGWFEAPFWVWSEELPTRRPLFVKPAGGRMLLSDLADGEWAMGAGDQGGLAELRASHGIKVRSRALLTTLYARLLLADVFLHGIGGAKYDQVADRVSQLFFGFAPPPHATLSATMRLPIDHPLVPPGEQSRLAHRLRSLEFHPEKFLTEEPSAADWIAEKQRWVATPKTPANARERHRAITQANEALRPLVEPQRQAVLQEQQRCERRLLAAGVLKSREYSFGLFPENVLRERILGLLP